MPGAVALDDIEKVSAYLATGDGTAEHFEVADGLVLLGNEGAMDFARQADLGLSSIVAAAFANRE
jgi:hypothetical protein